MTKKKPGVLAVPLTLLALLGTSCVTHYVDRPVPVTCPIPAIPTPPEIDPRDCLSETGETRVCLTPEETLALGAWIREMRRTYEELAACASAGDEPLPLANTFSGPWGPISAFTADLEVSEDPDFGAIERIYGYPVMRDVTIEWPAQCGEPNAYYSPSDETVIMCEELLVLGELVLDGRGEALGRAVLAHELGHALIDLADIPITGTEEAAADELAVVMLLSSGREADVLAFVDFFDWLAAGGDGTDDPYDVHLPHARRAWDAKCLVLGRRMYQDPGLHDYFAEFGWGALECERRWSRAVHDWNRLLDYARRAE